MGVVDGGQPADGWIGGGWLVRVVDGGQPADGWIGGG